MGESLAQPLDRRAPEEALAHGGVVRRRQLDVRQAPSRQPLLLDGKVVRAVQERQLDAERADRRSLVLAVRLVVVEALSQADRLRLLAEECDEVLERTAHGADG